VWWLDRLAGRVYYITKSEAELSMTVAHAITTAAATVVAQTRRPFIQMLHSNGWLLLLPATRHRNYHRSRRRM